MGAIPPAPSAGDVTAVSDVRHRELVSVLPGLLSALYALPCLALPCLASPYMLCHASPLLECLPALQSSVRKVDITTGKVKCTALEGRVERPPKRAILVRKAFWHEAW